MENFKYIGKYLKVSETEIDEHVWERVYLSNGVVIFPINEKGQILIIKEKRPHEKALERIKFITGHLDENEEVLTTANRELQEEVGLKAKYLQIFHEHHSNGTVNNSLYFVIAKGLMPSKLPNPDGEDTIMEQHYFYLDEIKEMILTEKIPFSFTALGLFKLEYSLSNNLLKV